MKKRSLILLGILLIAAACIGFNAYSGGAIVQTIESLAPAKKEITTTHLPNQRLNPSDYTSLADQQLATLTEQEKSVYNTIYDALRKRKDTANIRQDLKAEKVFELVQLVIAHHPEIFWSKGDCTFASNGILTLKYPYTLDEIEEKNELIEKKAQEILAEINPTGSEYDKSRTIFDYIVSNTSYAHNEIRNIDSHTEISTIEGVFLHSSAVCSGYAKAYQYLLALAGMDAITVTGTAQTPDGEGSHAWVAQVVDGEIYFTDPTWGDCYESTVNDHFVSHIYFLINGDDIAKTHKCDSFFECIKSTGSNSYFIKENLYFEEYSQADIRKQIKTSVEKNEKGIELKFANEDAYKKSQTALFENENIYFILMSVDLFSGKVDNEKISYSCNDAQRVITIFYACKENTLT